MNIRTFLTISAVLAAIFGLGFVLFPGPLTALYGVALDPVGQYVGQILGAALLGFAVINWTMRDAPDLNGLLLGNLVTNGIAFIASLIAEVSHLGGVNALGWLTVVLYLFFTVGNAYYRFFAHAPARRVVR